MKIIWVNFSRLRSLELRLHVYMIRCYFYRWIWSEVTFIEGYDPMLLFARNISICHWINIGVNLFLWGFREYGLISNFIFEFKFKAVQYKTPTPLIFNRYTPLNLVWIYFVKIILVLIYLVRIFLVWLFLVIKSLVWFIFHCFNLFWCVILARDPGAWSCSVIVTILSSNKKNQKKSLFAFALCLKRALLITKKKKTNPRHGAERKVKMDIEEKVIKDVISTVEDALLLEVAKKNGRRVYKYSF